MNDAIRVMLARYECRSASDYENALKEIIQEIALLGLWRAKFFEKACFYGGSALRILHGLDRFSEDLDFSLFTKNERFSLLTYFKAIEYELESFGFSVSIVEKRKAIDSTIESAFIKAGTLQNMLLIDVPKPVVKKMPPGKMMKIRLEVDIDPPGDFATEARYLFLPVPFSVNAYTLPDLFAGKMHAVLFRAWENRVKGRDWHDLVWYVARGVPVHLKHLENRMRQTRHLGNMTALSEESLKSILRERIECVDFLYAMKDVENLLKDTSSLSLWSKQYFGAVCDRIITV
jgi:predicted nucleotidyltransferase component of viral defense system